MSIKYQLNEQELSDIRKVRESDSLLVPLELWNSHIVDNNKIDWRNFPPYKLFHSFVITEREWFADVVYSLKYLYIENKRLPENEGGVWITTKLEQRKTMPKIDIFEAAHRTSGSFRSNG